MYSYIILANGTKNKPDNCQEHKWDSEVNIRLFFDCKHSIYSAIGRYIEIFRVASSIVICVYFVYFWCLLQLQLLCICYNIRIFTFPGLRIQTCGLSYIFQFVIWVMNVSSVINSVHCLSIFIWYFRYSLQQHSRLVLLLTKSILNWIMNISLLGG